jgi:hypothetical protein
MDSSEDRLVSDAGLLIEGTDFDSNGFILNALAEGLTSLRLGDKPTSDSCKATAARSRRDRDYREGLRRAINRPPALVLRVRPVTLGVGRDAISRGLSVRLKQHGPAWDLPRAHETAALQGAVETLVVDNRPAGGHDEVA